MKQFHTPCTHSCVLVIKMYQQKFYIKIYFKILNAAWIIASNSFQNFQNCAIRESSTYTCTFYIWSREKCELAKPIFRSCIGQNVFKGSNQWSAIVQNPYPDGRYYVDLDLRTSTSDLRKTKRSSLFHEHKWFFTIR